MNKIKIYSPLQVATSSFVGGPFAAVYVLKKNFDALSDYSRSKQTLLWGSVFIIALFLVLPFLPDKFPHYVLPIAYTVTTRLIAEKYQMTKQAIADSPQFGFQSNWKVFGLSVAFFVAFLVIGMLWLLGLQSLGVIELK